MCPEETARMMCSLRQYAGQMHVLYSMFVWAKKDVLYIYSTVL